MKTNGFIVYLFVITLQLSCKDDELSGKVLLDKVTQVTNIEQTDKYLYNDAGQVIRCNHYEGTKLIDYSEYTYNTNNQLETRRYFVGNHSDFELYYTNTFKYNSDNKPIEVVTTGVRQIVHKITWDDGRINKVECLEDNSMTYVEYEYSEEGNIAVIVGHQNDGSIDYVLNCSYDNHRNPFYDFKDPMEMVSENTTKICPNNLISMTQKIDFDSEVHATTEIIYVYSDLGLPKEGVFKTTYLGNTTEYKTKYYYKRM
jgi:hypothetical protein